MKDDCHLHGRSAEESILLNSYFASLSLNADSPASMILVWGDSGVGKSKIAESLRPHVLEDDGYFIRGKFDQLSCCGDMALSSGSHTNSSHVPYGGIASAFVEYCNLLEERGCEAWREVAEKLKREIGMEDGRVLFEAIPALERIFIRNENSRGESSSSRHENWSQFHSDTIHAQNRNNNIGYFLLEEEEKKQSDRSLESRHGYTEIRLHRLNHLLKKFIHAISSVGDPIILLVDDVQWADLSSLELLRNLIQGATSPFTFIFTYRPIEPSHPFLQMIKELEHTRITKTEIHLRNLGEKSVYDLVESTLNIDPKKARGMMPRTLEEMKLDNDERVEKCTSLKTLTHEICNITNGNPFFIKQQIIYWIGQGLLALDENDQWVWDIDKIRESNVLGDVVSMILEKIKMLPVSTQRALTICACIGSKVDLDLLGLLFREMHFPNDDARGIEEVEEDAISVALEEMLLVYNEDRTKVAFVHDSIQSAAYSQLDPTKHAAFHLQLGRILAQNLSHETWEKHLFIVAHQLARGYKLISHRDERVFIAGRIFLRAGDKAAAASAFPEAKFFYARGIDMIDNDEDWESSYQLCMDCFSKGAEAAAIAGDYEQMDVWLRVAIRRSIGLDDQFRAHYIHVRSLAQRNEMEKAVDVGLEALELIGVRIPSDNVKLHTLIELFKTRRLMKRICVADLKKIEPNKEKQVVSASRLLNILSTLSLSGKKHLCPLICFKSVQFNIKHGILLGMPISLATYGFLLSRFGMLREATSYCEMANSVREDLGIVETIASVNMAIYGIVFPFSKPLGECEKQLRHGYTAGFEVGDVANSLRCASLHRYISFFSGQPLPKFLKGVDKISKLMKEYNSNSTLLVNLVYQQAAVNFSGSGGASPGPAYLNGDFCDYNKIEQQFQEKTHSILHEQMNLMQTILAYHFAHYDTGWKSSEKIRICGGGSTFKGFIFQYIHIFYRGLTAIALSRNENDNRKYAAVVKACVKDLKIGRKKSPLNLSHQSYLLEAELAVTKKRYAFAERLFLLSIEHAASAGILHEHALAHERFGFYYMVRNNHEAAYEQIRLARDLYAKWGSKAKIDFLSKKFPHLREKQRDHREMIELRRCST